MIFKKDIAEPRCSFCGKLRKEVKKIIAGPEVFICNECISICTEILIDDQIITDTQLAPTAESEPRSFHTGSFTCPKCQTTFALYSKYSDISDA